MQRVAHALRPAAAASARRNLHVHEHVAKAIMMERGIDCQRGVAVSRAEDVPPAAARLHTDFHTNWFVVKSAVLAGGRGKGVFDTGFKGGVKLAKSAAEAEQYARSMLGHRLITKQTAAHGAPVSKVFLAECLDIKKEYYFAVMLSPKFQGSTIVASSQGGVEIETVAKDSPEAIITIPVDIRVGFKKEAAEDLARRMGFEAQNVGRAADVMKKLYDYGVSHDAIVLEINPLVETDDGRVACVDAKFQFDDSAAFRRQEIFKEEDESQEDLTEVRMKNLGLNYIALEGNIACMVNGAGLAMATMDIINLYGGKPANFLDVGGGASAKGVKAALESISEDPGVKGVLVNIFGGIMRCDEVAKGVIAALETIPKPKPMVIRMTGTNHQQAWDLLNQSGCKFVKAEDLDDAAKKIVELCKS